MAQKLHTPLEQEIVGPHIRHPDPHPQYLLRTDALDPDTITAMPAQTIRGNALATSAAPQDLTTTEVKQLLDIEAADVSGLASIARTGSAGDLVTGTVPDARMPAMSGDIESVVGTTITTIQPNVVDNAKLAQMPTLTLKGNDDGGDADPQDLTATEAKALLAIDAADVTGVVPDTRLINTASPITGGADLSADVNLGFDQTVDLDNNARVSVDFNSSGTPIGIRRQIDFIEGANVTLIVTDVPGSEKVEVMIAATGGVGSGVTDPGANGIMVRNAFNVSVAREIQGASPIDVADGDGVGGDPSISFDQTVDLDNNARVAVSKNSGATVGERRRINLIEGSGISITMTDDAGNEEIDITLATTGSGIADGDYGDVTVSGSGTVITIDAGAVSNSKMAAMATMTIKGNNTGGASAPIDLTAAQVKTLLAIAAGDVSGLATIATSGSASDLGAGTVPAARMPAHTGDVTSSAGSVALTIPNDTVTYAKMQNSGAADVLVGRGNGSGTGDLQELTLGSGLALATTVLGLTSALARFTSLTPLAITGAASATLNRWHVVSGTSADYEIEINGLSPATGDVVAFYVKDFAAANKQFKLDAGGTVKIAGRTRYLVLLHTNVAVLQWDGTDWQPLSLSLDTMWVDGGAMTFTATTSNPTKGTTGGKDHIYWRRCGQSLQAQYRYKHTVIGANGTGTYIVALPIGAADASVPTIDGEGESTTVSTGWSYSRVGQGSITNNNTAMSSVNVMMKSTTTFEIHCIDQTNNVAMSASFYGFGSHAALRFAWEINLPMADW